MSKISLVRKTSYKCGHLQRQILAYLKKVKRPVPLEELLKVFAHARSRRWYVKRAVQQLAKRMIVVMDV